MSAHPTNIQCTHCMYNVSRGLIYLDSIKFVNSQGWWSIFPSGLASELKLGGGGGGAGGGAEETILLVSLILSEKLVGGGGDVKPPRPLAPLSMTTSNAFYWKK